MALVERLKEKPFAIVGVASDDPAEMKRIVAENKINWRNAVDGGTDGPIATAWNVHSWPTVFVLDAEGTIRHRDLRGDDLDKAVEDLLAEIEGSGK